MDSLIDMITTAKVETPQVALQFIEDRRTELELKQLIVHRCDQWSLICFVTCDSGTKYTVVFDHPNGLKPHDVNAWNALVEYTGSPLVLFQNEHWIVFDFIEGQGGNFYDDQAVDLALKRLVLIGSCSTAGLSLGLAITNPAVRLRQHSQKLLDLLKPQGQVEANLRYINQHAADFLPEHEANLVLAHRDYEMRNIIFQKLEIEGCRVIDWNAALAPRWFDLAMFLLDFFNVDRNRFWEKLAVFLRIAGREDYLEDEFRGYMLLVVLHHAMCGALVQRPAAMTLGALQWLDGVLHGWTTSCI